MKKNLLTTLALFLGMMLITGCGQDDSPKEEEPPQKLYPVSINGTEIRVGETTVQALLDQGLSVTVSEMDSSNHITTYEIDPEEMLEPDSYYSGASITITEHIFAHVSLATSDPVRMGDAVIAMLEFYLGGDSEERSAIALNGVNVNELDQEKAEAMFPEFSSYTNYMAGYGPDYEYSLSFGQQDGLLSKFTVKRKYDVDWSN